MGLLDDAIREHLDLKRRQGASDDELRRQEAEALGPARREPPPAEPAEGEPAATEPAPPLVEETAGGEEPLAGPTVEPVEPGLTQLAEEPGPSEVPESEALEPPPPEPVEEPAEPQPEDVLGGEDVLEETPDFLQETPEHDRAWFEQKPPRDFDFD